MRFTCSKEILEDALIAASTFAETNNIAPGRRRILAEAFPDEVHLIGYDQKIGVTCVLDATVEETGGIAFDVKHLEAALEDLDDDAMITFSTTARDYTPYAHILYADKVVEFEGSFVDAYPDLPTVSGGRSFTIAQCHLKDMIPQVTICVSPKKRTVQAGVLFDVEAGTLTMVASDNFRLALRREKLLAPLDGTPFHFVISGSDLEQLEEFFEDTEDPVTVTEGTGHCSFRFGDRCLIVRCLKGDFLPYRSVLPTTSAEIRVEADVEDLQRAVETAAEVFHDKPHPVVVCKFSTDGALTITGKRDSDTSEGVCPITGNGKDLVIGFDSTFLTDAFYTVPAQRVRMDLSTPTSPCVILPTDGAKDNFLYMIFPVRLRPEQIT